MEILSDATFKGNVTISGGDFSVTRKGESAPVILTGPCGSTGKVDINGCVNFYSDINVSDNVWISGSLTAYSGACINGDFSVTRSGESSPSFVVGSITTDNGSTGSEFQSTTIGGVFVNGDFSVTKAGESTPLIATNVISDNGYHTYALNVNGSEFIHDDLVLGSDLHMTGSNFIMNGGQLSIEYGAKIYLDGSSISRWSDLNTKLDFAPKSLSSTVSSLCTTVSSHTTKINSACSTINSLCTKFNSLCTDVSSNTNKINCLCTTVAGIQPYTKHVFGNPYLPAGCTKFYFVDNVELLDGTYGNDKYKFIRDCRVSVSSVQIFKGGYEGPNEEVQMDIKQYKHYSCSTGANTGWFEGTLASNTTGYDESEFLLVFDNYKGLCTTETLPQ